MMVLIVETFVTDTATLTLTAGFACQTTMPVALVDGAAVVAKFALTATDTPLTTVTVPLAWATTLTPC